MNDFDYDAAVKKRIAQGAKHKVGGVRRRGCRLPSDNLTLSQLKKRNGEIMTYTLGTPMKWAEFDSMPDDVKIEYIGSLVDKFGLAMNYSSLAAMFHKNYEAVRKELKRLGFAFSKVRCSETQTWNFKEFCAGRYIEACEPDAANEYDKNISPTPFHNSEEERAESIEEDKKAISPTPVHNPGNVLQLLERVVIEGQAQDAIRLPVVPKVDQFNIEFSGNINIDSIAETLKAMIGNNGVGRIGITYLSEVKA